MSVAKKLTRSQKIIKEIQSIALIVVAVFAFRSMFFEPFKIPSGSMIPTLKIGDFILVNKFAYGFKIPFSDYFTNPVYITSFKNPARGDVIVFKYPKDTSINYIKRVVGLPGDTIEIKDKIVYVNDEAIGPTDIDGEQYLADMDEKFKSYKFRFYKVKTGEHEHVIQLDEENLFKPNYAKITIEPNKFFVMGDNRDYSLDSRFWGFVPKEYIKGKALFIWFSMILPFTEDGFKFRPERIGKTIP